MDEKFLEELKSVSVQDILQEQRPTTAFRLSTARGPRGSSVPPTGGLFGGPSIPEASAVSAFTMSRSASPPEIGQSDEITTLASYRPESAAFTFSFNRPKTGKSRRQESEEGAVGGRRAPSAFRNRGNNVGGSNHVRAMSSTRSNSTFMAEETVEFIPDLDDVNEEDLQMTVASAPAYEVQRMASLKELDAELMQSKPFSVVDGVNLRKLCKFIVPEKQLMEHDEHWTWDSLYTEIVSSPELGELMRMSRKDVVDPDLEAITSKVP